LATFVGKCRNMKTFLGLAAILAWLCGAALLTANCPSGVAKGSPLAFGIHLVTLKVLSISLNLKGATSSMSDLELKSEVGDE
jgi:hypothetical protein